MTMRLRLLKFAARRPLLALSLATATAVAAVGGVAAAVMSRSTHCCGHAAQVDQTAETADGTPRMILGRVWFDKLPEKRTDMIQIWIFFGGGVAFYEKGSAYRLTLDSAEFERQGDKIHLTYLQDKKSVDSKFTVKACEDKPPFDLCLDFESAVGGQKRWYGFGDEDDMANKVPWAKAVMKAAEGRSSIR